MCAWILGLRVFLQDLHGILNLPQMLVKFPSLGKSQENQGAVIMLRDSLSIAFKVQSQLLCCGQGGRNRDWNLLKRIEN